MIANEIRFVDGKFVTGHTSRTGAFVDVRDCPTRACFDTNTLCVEMPRGVEGLKGFSASIVEIVSEEELNPYWVVATALRVVLEGGCQVVVTPGTGIVWRLRRTERSLQEEAVATAAWEKRQTEEPQEKERAVAVVRSIVIEASKHHRKALRRWALSGGWKQGGVQEVETWLAEEVGEKANTTFLNVARFIRQSEFVDAVKKALQS